MSQESEKIDQLSVALHRAEQAYQKALRSNEALAAENGRLRHRITDMEDAKYDRMDAHDKLTGGRSDVELMEEIAQLRRLLGDCASAMRVWGSWEDGIPASDQGGELGAVGAAYDAAVLALAWAQDDCKRMAMQMRRGEMIRTLESERDALKARVAELEARAPDSPVWESIDRDLTAVGNALGLDGKFSHDFGSVDLAKAARKLTAERQAHAETRAKLEQLKDDNAQLVRVNARERAKYAEVELERERTKAERDDARAKLEAVTRVPGGDVLAERTYGHGASPLAKIMVEEFSGRTAVHLANHLREALAEVRRLRAIIAKPADAQGSEARAIAESHQPPRANEIACPHIGDTLRLVTGARYRVIGFAFGGKLNTDDSELTLRTVLVTDTSTREHP